PSTSAEPHSSSRLKVALFTFANELQVVPGADVGEFKLETGESESTSHDPWASGLDRDMSKRPTKPIKRLVFPVVAPARAGKYRIRCNVYFNNALVQSRLIFVRVRKLPRVV